VTRKDTAPDAIKEIFGLTHVPRPLHVLGVSSQAEPNPMETNRQDPARAAFPGKFRACR
jgi:hypothetical protein